ncbi:MAG TPA: hypothetical protein VNL14_08090 [Candidatus Acidoferrales bacterium]|nr:hypothetical protein [Candidatus Acidoferrales bacterium]
MARTKRSDKKWLLVFAALGFVALLSALAFWLGLRWFGARSKAPEKKPTGASGETISQEDRRQLDRIVKERRR